MTTEQDRRPKLTASEIAALWTAYMDNTMSQRVMTIFLKDVEDTDILSIIQFFYDISISIVETIINVFTTEKIPIPTGFTDEDVNLNSPRLYTDMFMLSYVQQMGKASLLALSGFTSMSARKDIRTLFSEALIKTDQFFNQAVDIAASKGLLVRSPYINYPSETAPIDSHKYLSGFSLFNKKRPLNSVEISYLHENIQSNVLGTKLALSFAQTSPRKEVQKFMLRGSEISEKHLKLFTNILLENDIHPPMPSDVTITDSTTAPFSDKMMMFLMGLLSAIGVGNYATATASSLRSDLILSYERLSWEIGQLAKDGADIMIKNAWLEQPPTTKDKKALARNKGNNQ